MFCEYCSRSLIKQYIVESHDTLLYFLILSHIILQGPDKVLIGQHFFQSIVHNSLISPNMEERIDGARHLGSLGVCDTMVLYALRERLRNDTEKRVVYEAAKSLALLGRVLFVPTIELI